AASVGLDAVADLAVRVRGAARRAVILDREVQVRALAVPDAVGTDGAGVADVDHVRRLGVETDAEAADEHGDAREQPDRPDGDRPRGAAVPTDADRAREQPEEPRVGEDRRGEDAAV